LRPIFARHIGKEMKTIGDSFLVEFDSALSATLCAVEIQKFLHDYNISTRDEWKIKLRIGIHLGVVRRDEDIFGDAVNIASRIQPLSEPEDICLSQQVFDQIRNKTSYPLVKLESVELKNVTVSIEVYKVVLPWMTQETVQSTYDRNRIAILPFANISPDPKDEYFADGITDELISTVSKLRELKVISRTSVLRYKGGDKNIGVIGRELAVGSVLEGSLRKIGDRVRITAQLIDVQMDQASLVRDV
jgi:adenylate cyclase